ncbi:MAG: hypothetical protein M3R48_03410, partial [Candidatus Dormibacteraeota bacterium]|nr:hypothetical protein [Candidatus Dormibacteraeota bacterium]
VAAGAAHNGITTSTLGVGVDYHLGLMSHVAECGNGEFHHVAQLDDLEGILAGEFLEASAATARNVEVTMNVAAAVAVGSNLNRLRQADIADGVRVSLGDMVRGRDFLIELTTPVEMAGNHLDVRVLVEGLGADGLIEARHSLKIALVSADEEAVLPVDESIVARVAVGLQMQADMDTSLAAEDGDLDAAANALTSLRSSAVQLSAAYGATVANSARLVGTVDYLDSLALRTQTPQSPRVLKSRFDMAKMTSRGRAQLIGPCPVCGEHAFFEGEKGGRVLRNCTACGHMERPDR